MLAMRSMVGIAATAVAMAAAANAVPGGPSRLARPQQLQLRPDGTFRLALFCDMHYGEAEDKDAKSVQFEHTLIGLEKPDLVVVDGDASSNYAAPECGADGQACKDFFLANWRKFTSPMEETGTPYAYALGNHDRIPGAHAGPLPSNGSEANYAVPDHWIMALDGQNEHSATQDGPSTIHGASNYVVPVLDAAGQPAFYVWLLDSSDNNCLGHIGWGCVYPDQVEWFRATSKALAKKDGRVVPGVMFHHIPLPEVMHAWSDPSVEVIGTRGEGVACFSYNTGFFAAIKEMGNILAVFHGHDHNNDFVANYQGVHIGYGRKSAWGGYGGVVGYRRGSRIIELRVSANGTRSWDTWIRLETGEIDEQVPAKSRMPQTTCIGEALDDSTAKATDPAELCRARDDAQMCRVASGMVPMPERSFSI